VQKYNGVPYFIGRLTKKKKPQDENIMSASAMQGGHNKVAALLHVNALDLTNRRNDPLCVCLCILTITVKQIDL